MGIVNTSLARLSEVLSIQANGNKSKADTPARMTKAMTRARRSCACRPPPTRRAARAHVVGTASMFIGLSSFRRSSFVIDPMLPTPHDQQGQRQDHHEQDEGHGRGIAHLEALERSLVEIHHVK